MAKKDKKKVSKIKVKKKLWFKVISPTIFGMKEIGESYLSNAEKAVGRLMKINLKNLTGSMRDQNVYISLKINGVKGQTLQTQSVGYELVPIYIKRAVRKNTSRVDDVLDFKTKDGKEVKLKALVMAMNRIPKSTATEVRKALKKELNEEISKGNFESFLTNIVNFRIQLGLKKKLTKIYPVREVMIRSVKLVDLKEKTVVVDESEKPITDKKSEEVTEEKQEIEEFSKEKVVEETPIEETKEEVTEKEEIQEATEPETTEETKEKEN